MAHPEIEEWLNSAEGISMNPDGHYGLQCVDAADQYAQDLSGVAWPQSMGGVAGAKQILDAAPDEYWVRTDNNPDDPNLIPKRGDVMVFGGSDINQWGHVCIAFDPKADGAWVIQQDGFAPPLVWADGALYSNKPAHKAWLPYYQRGTGPLIGWLTFREEKLQGYVPPAASNPPVQSGQRITGPFGVNGRDQASRNGAVVKAFDGDLILTFKGFVHGENIDGNDVWFVGAVSGTFFHSSAFTDGSTSGLPDLTPAPAPAPAPAAQELLGFQRVTGGAGVNLRDTAHKNATILKTFDPDLILDFKGFVHGEDPYGGNDVWFVGKYSDTYAWSGAFTDSGTHDLPDLTPTAIKPVEKYNFDLDFVTLRREDGVVITVEKSPADIGNLQLGNPTAKHGTSVIHQFGTPGVDTFDSCNWQFLKVGTLVSAYWSVSGRRVRQHVSLKDRAYHASTVGNDYIGIETDPIQDPETIATVRALLIALKEKENTNALVLHRNVPGNSTNCGALIDLVKYAYGSTSSIPVIVPEIVIPKPTAPPVVTPPASETPGPDHSAEVASLLQMILNLLKRIFGNKK